MKVFDWKSESGVNYASVVDSVTDITAKYTMVTEEKPSQLEKTHIVIDTDGGRYTVFRDIPGYIWFQHPVPDSDDPGYRSVTTSLNRFLDKVYEADKKIRLAAPVE